MEVISAAAADEMAWAGFLGDDFSVDDLLTEPEEQEFGQEAEADSYCNQDSSTVSSPSVASFEPHSTSMELDFHTEDVAELEWVSRFVDDSFFEFPSSAESKKVQSAAALATANIERPVIVVPVKARSKRLRTKSSLWASYNLCYISTSPERRGRKKQHQSSESGTRRCSHCGTEKTPQWRAGAMGAKTLCNACGVRFKSGRLLPEYRPASSPTFVTSVHSNSHRRVMEMRRVKEEEEEDGLLGFC